MTRLLLASASPARLSTLAAAGIAAAVRVSGVDEDAVLRRARETYGSLEPADAVLLLAHAKAEAVAAAAEDDDAAAADGDASGEPSAVAHDHDLVLGCDSMLELDGEVLGKPADAADAVRRWRSMRGRSGTLHTGHWLIDLRDPDEDGTGATLGATSSTVVQFAEVTDGEIDAYVATGEPLAVAGAFTVDGLGGPFVTRIDGDHHGVVGLSLPLLRSLLGELGLSIVDLWDRRPAAGDAI